MVELDLLKRVCSSDHRDCWEKMFDRVDESDVCFFERMDHIKNKM